jgi:hypothetical protein
MTIAILILTALVLPLALIYLTVATNEFEKNTKALAAFIQKRYTIEPAKKASEAAGSMESIVKLPGRA